MQFNQIVSEEDRVVESHEVLRRLVELTNQTTVPNIFINGKHLGGSTDLIDANNSGKLQKMLESKNPNWVDSKTVKPIPAGWSDVLCVNSDKEESHLPLS